jgi:pilus assembly protein Flp/PilA
MSRKHLAASTEENRPQPAVAARAFVNQGVDMARLMRIIRCERAATAIEYALVGALISIAALAAMTQVGTKIGTMYNNVGNHL